MKTGDRGVRHHRYHALIFLTGAVILATEVLASRIMTPYFGVSLYIWAAILSTTLAFLAIGYYWGGTLSRGGDRETVTRMFLALPVAAAASLVVSSALYPVVFPSLLANELVVGSFFASALLLAVPLIALSAMNPLLVAIERGQTAAGDAGAGRVFFISTAGSVLGVNITAFMLIPYLTNFRSLLLLSMLLSVAAVILLKFARELPAVQRKRILMAALATVLAGVSLLLGQQTYLASLASRDSFYEFDVRAEYTSLFGNVKVVEIRPRNPSTPSELAYLQDGLIQNRTDLNGESLSAYTYVLEELAGKFAPAARTAMVLGLGAGIVPRSLRERGLDVTVVEINADALHAAQRYFGFDPTAVDVRVVDARTFVRRCGGTYDVVVADLFQGDGMPDYLMTREFFTDIRRCLGPSGALVMNAFFDDSSESANRHLLATIVAAFANVYVYRSDTLNAYIVGTGSPVSDVDHFEPSQIPAVVRLAVAKTLASGQSIGAGDVARYLPITDNKNIAGVLFRATQQRLRHRLARRLPPHVMVN